MTTQSFDPQFLAQFNISGFHKVGTSGGQKQVHFPIVNNQNQVLKIYNRQDERADRELEIYDKFKNNMGIPKIIAAQRYGSQFIVFEEFIEGETLTDIASNYLNDSGAVTQLMKNIIEIMTPIWLERLVHRDIKPDNIIIRNDGSPVIIDFGIARDLDASSLTGTGFQPMSWMFASPEQYAGNKDQISYRTDFFSLGALAYYLYYGQLPFGQSHAAIDSRFKSSNELLSTDTNCDLNNFCTESLKFSPAERPRTIDALTSTLK